MNDSFIFYRSFFEAIKKLPDADSQNKLFLAVANYALDGQEPTLSYPLDMAFELIKPQLDANSKRKESGSKGGRPKKAENVTKFAKGMEQQNYDVEQIEKELGIG